MIISFGKYSGKSVTEIAESREGRNYLEWIIENNVQGLGDGVAKQVPYFNQKTFNNIIVKYADKMRIDEEILEELFEMFVTEDGDESNLEGIEDPSTRESAASMIKELRHEWSKPKRKRFMSKKLTHFRDRSR